LAFIYERMEIGRKGRSKLQVSSKEENEGKYWKLKKIEASLKKGF